VTYHGAPNGLGHIELIVGSMFSGKSEELIRRLRRAQIARRRVQVFSPFFEDRVITDITASHTDLKIHAVAVEDPADILKQLDERTEVVGVDEAQFFGSDIVEVCERLANQGRRVIVAGLDQDYLGRPFAPVPALMAVAEYITKTLAVCVQCGAPANRTQRLDSAYRSGFPADGPLYEARCRRCFEPELSRQLQLHVESGPDPDDLLS
jgi:thymidine kinase